jgi:tetratricopeptide (TPR) repeat protein
MPPAEIPDFDSMSPEEVMAWMESLAKRQGAKEGFLTEANMDIAEIDPATVQIDEPGYVPFGEETRKPPAQATEKVPVPAPQAPQAPPPPPPAPKTEPVVAPEPTLELAEPEAEEAIELGGLDWLESLAANQGAELPQMDLSALSAELSSLTAAAPEPEEIAAPTNPLDWLENLAEGELADTAPQPAQDTVAATSGEVDLASITDPLAAGIDPMLWLESLARRQGARAEELTTSADMDIPVPDNVKDTGPGYEAFSVESETRTPAAPAKPKTTIDPAAWLESITAGETAVEPDSREMSDEEIQAALAQGSEIPPDQMEKFFARQLDRGFSLPEEAEDIPFDPDAPPIPAELPDWLLEQVQPPDDLLTSMASDSQQSVLRDEIVEPPSVPDLPDWLQATESQQGDLELENIFDTEAEAPTLSDEERTFYSTDPWVQAFSEEAAADPNVIPEWYEKALRDPRRYAAVEQQLGGVQTLADADLPPETSVPAGAPEAVPDWLTGSVAAAEAEAVPAEASGEDWLMAEGEYVDEALPDWLAETNLEVPISEIPDWLKETIETEEAQIEPSELIFAEAEPEPEPEPAPPVQVIQPQPAPTPQPEPVRVSPQAQPIVAPAAPVPVLAGEAAAVLESARAKTRSGDLDSGLLDYERVIRANAALDQVVADLTQLAEQQKENPAVYRVLGDGLMRQGKLQAALDTYRRALNQL